jgi:hypothetical protein
MSIGHLFDTTPQTKPDDQPPVSKGRTAFVPYKMLLAVIIRRHRPWSLHEPKDANDDEIHRDNVI